MDKIGYSVYWIDKLSVIWIKPSNIYDGWINHLMHQVTAWISIVYYILTMQSSYRITDNIQMKFMIIILKNRICSNLSTQFVDRPDYRN